METACLMALIVVDMIGLILMMRMRIAIMMVLMILLLGTSNIAQSVCAKVYKSLGNNILPLKILT
jgi:hypothetical protein